MAFESSAERIAIRDALVAAFAEVPIGSNITHEQIAKVVGPQTSSPSDIKYSAFKLAAEESGVAFESIVVAVESGGLLDILAHPNQTKYPNQRVMVVSFDGYVYLVPFLEEAEYFFLKTVIPSRKATRDYLKQGEPDAKN